MSLVLIGSSSAMVSVSAALCKAARFDKSVLLLGETGTGKDLAARKIHELSARRACPFIAINCSNLTDGLFESELFGHVRGAFTGAVREKSGLLDVAENGTVFLDEIGELPLHLQAKVLRLLDKKESRRIGGTRTRTIHARFIFATNRNLYGSVLEGKFRKDLYYRINVVRIFIPALRERKEDIPALVNHFFERENQRSGTHKALTPEALEKLLAYNFPGNVRELENVVERSFVFSDSNIVAAEDIHFDAESPGVDADSKREHLISILEQCRWNKTKAAAILGKSRRHLYRLIMKYNLSDFGKNDFGGRPEDPITAVPRK
jgi:transcriptional regulator with GAF, ATPase, and Fis domain